MWNSPTDSRVRQRVRKPRSIPLVVAVGMLVAVGAHAPRAEAASIIIVANDASVSACATAIPAGTHCYFVGNRVTAARSGNTVTATNAVIASVGDTLILQNQSGSHNVIFCKEGTIINGWNCGDPMVSGGPEPGRVSASTAGAPAMITTGAPDGYGAVSYAAESYYTTLDAPGTFYFWCGLGSHRFGGQYGRLDVSASAGGAVTTTVPSAQTMPKPSAVSLVLTKAKGRVTAKGTATAGARVYVQKWTSGAWKGVGSTMATVRGSYSLTIKAEKVRTRYRAVVGAVVSPTKSI